MAQRIEFTPAALSDLEAIAFYGATEFGLVAAARHRQELDEKFRLIAVFPEIGPGDRGEGDGVRALSAPPHRIVYRVSSDRIVILRVLHARQLPPDLA